MPRKPPTPKPSKSTVSRTGRSADAMAGAAGAKTKAALKAGGRSKVGYTEKGVYISNGGTVFEPFSKRKTASDAIVKPTIKKKAAAKKLSPSQR